MPSITTTQFVFDHHRLMYMHGKEDAYAFSVNTVTNTLESANILHPAKVEELVELWQNCDLDVHPQSVIQETRLISFKITPLRRLPFATAWKTTEMLPNAARAIWNKRNSSRTPIKMVTAYVEGGLAVSYRPWDGMGNPMKHSAFHAAFGGVWLPMRYDNGCPVVDGVMPRISDIYAEQVEANLS